MSRETPAPPFLGIAADPTAATKLYLAAVYKFYHDEIDFADVRADYIRAGVEQETVHEIMQKLKKKSIPAFLEGCEAVRNFLNSPEYQQICEYFPDAPDCINETVVNNAEAFLAVSKIFLPWLTGSIASIPQTLEKAHPGWKPGDISFKEILPIYDQDSQKLCPPLLGMMLRDANILTANTETAVLEASEAAAEAMDVMLPSSKTYFANSKVSNQFRNIYNAGENGLSINVAGKNSDPIYTMAQITFVSMDGVETRMETLPDDHMNIVRAVNSILADQATAAAVAAGESPSHFGKYLRNLKVSMTLHQIWKKINPQATYFPSADELHELEKKIDSLRCLIFEIDCRAESEEWDKLSQIEYSANVITATKSKKRTANGTLAVVYEVSSPSPDFQYSADKNQVYVIQDKSLIIYKRDSSGKITKMGRDKTPALPSEDGLVLNQIVNMNEDKEIVRSQLYCSIRPIIDGKTQSKKLSYETLFRNAGTKDWKSMDAVQRRRWRDFIMNCLASWSQATNIIENGHFEEYKRTGSNAWEGIEYLKGKWKPEHFLLTKPKAKSKPKSAKRPGK